MDRDELIAALRAAGCVFAEDEADVLRSAARSAPELAAMARRRIEGEPLEHVVGWAGFAGLRIAVAPGVFVPRRRTELMARRAVALLADRPDRLLLELCCGAGAVAAVVQRTWPDTALFAVDLDPIAVTTAHHNLPTATVLAGDLYAPLPEILRGRVPVIAANAPYVPTEAIALMPPEARDHEQRLALDGGSDGLDVLRRVVAGAGEWLTPDGAVLVEAAARQVDTLADYAQQHGLIPIVHTDEEIGGLVIELRPGPAALRPSPETDPSPGPS